MSNTEAIQKLRELELRCWEGEMGRLGEWVAECLGDYFAHGSEGRTLEQAFGLASKQGESSWRRNEALAKRDAALREFAEMYLAGMSARVQADRILEFAREHVAGSWRLPPTEEPRKHLLGRALKAAELPKARQLRRILGTSGH